MAVFTTLDLGTGRAVRGSDVVLTPDPRTVRLRDAGRTVRVQAARRGCGSSARPATTAPARARSGSASATARSSRIKPGRNATVRVPISKSTKRGKELPVLLKTRLAPAKRLTLTLRAQEARR